jgi:hypothetical protein
MTTGGVVHAQANSAASSSGNGMRVSPVRSDLTIKPGTSQTVDVYVQNISGGKSKLKAIVNDFDASDDESGKPRILLDEKSESASHGLKRYIDKIENFELQADERRIIKVKISIPASAAGGGYYGAVRFLPQEVDASKNLSLSASVGSLILVTVPGNITEQASVVSLNVARKEGKASNLFTNGSSLKASIRIRNSGNVQLSPYGKVQLKKGSKELGTFEINNTDPKGSILPDSIRKFSVDFGDKTKTLGKYTVSGNFGYGDKGQLIMATTSFYVVPLPIVITLVVCLLLIIVAIAFGPRWMKRHDRSLMRKVRKS